VFFVSVAEHWATILLTYSSSLDGICGKSVEDALSPSPTDPRGAGLADLNPVDSRGEVGLSNYELKRVRLVFSDPMASDGSG
jgi:hypothetical protein